MSETTGVLPTPQLRNGEPTGTGCLMMALTLVSSTFLSVAGGFLLILALAHH